MTKITNITKDIKYSDLAGGAGHNFWRVTVLEGAVLRVITNL